MTYMDHNNFFVIIINNNDVFDNGSTCHKTLIITKWQRVKD